MTDLPSLAAGAPASLLLLASIVIVSLLGLSKAPWLVERCLLRPHGLVQRGDWHTLVTSGFIHADLPHLLFNGFTFWAFGFGLERTIGTPAFVALYTVGPAVQQPRHLVQAPAAARLRAAWARRARSWRCCSRRSCINPSASIFILPIPVPIPAPLFALAYLGFSVFASRSRRGASTTMRTSPARSPGWCSWRWPTRGRLRARWWPTSAALER